MKRLTVSSGNSRSAAFRELLGLLVLMGALTALFLWVGLPMVAEIALVEADLQLSYRELSWLRGRPSYTVEELEVLTPTTIDRSILLRYIEGAAHRSQTQVTEVNFLGQESLHYLEGINLTMNVFGSYQDLWQLISILGTSSHVLEIHSWSLLRGAFGGGQALRLELTFWGQRAGSSQRLPRGERFNPFELP